MDNTLFWVSYFSLWIIVVALFGAVFFLYRYHGEMMLNSRQGRDQQGPEVGKPIPAARLSSLNGNYHELGKSNGNPQLVFFAATECKPCHRLRPGFATFADQYKSIDSVLVCRGTERGVESFASNLPSNVIVIADPRWDLGTRLRVYSTPFVVIADKDGIVRGKGNPKDGAALNAFIEQLEDQPKTVELLAF